MKQDANSGEMVEVDPSSLLRFYITDGPGNKEVNRRMMTPALLSFVM